MGITSKLLSDTHYKRQMPLSDSPVIPTKKTAAAKLRKLVAVRLVLTNGLFHCQAQGLKSSLLNTGIRRPDCS